MSIKAINKNLMIDFLFLERKQVEIRNKIKELSENDLKEIIDFLFIIYDSSRNSIVIYVNDKINKPKIKQQQLLVNVLSKYKYYKEKILQEVSIKNAVKYIRKEEFSLIKKLSVNKKEDFLNIISEISCTSFFLLNYNKFDYSEEEKKMLSNNLSENLFPKLDITEKQNIVNKTSIIYPLVNTVEFFNLTIEKNKEECDFIIKNAKYLDQNKDTSKLILNIFLSPHKLININNNAEIDNEYYLLFFKNNLKFLKPFEDFVKEYVIFLTKSFTSHSIDVDKMSQIIGLADKLMLTEELEKF